MSQLRCISCHSCGFPMEKPEDHALNNVINLYCHHCTNEKGELLPFETILQANIRFYMESQGISEAAATKMANDILSGKPAWKHLYGKQS